MVGEALFILLRVFLVCLDVLAVEMLYHVDVKGYASPIAVAGPLRVLDRLARFFVSPGTGVLPSSALSHTLRHHNFHTALPPFAL